jgi:hypothetical protein
MNSAASPIRRRAHSIAATVFAGSAALLTYTCMYAFRKPFAAASFSGLTLFGVDYKIWLVIAQILGYMCSKFIGVRVIGELRPERRQWLLLGLIGSSWLALLGFALVPPPWNIPFLFLNGLPLGMVWGLVFSYLEGRSSTEVMAAILASSFIMASGLVKTIGKWLLLHGVSEFWMPFACGLFFIPLLVFSVRMLERIPPPDAADLRERSPRLPLNRAERRAFVRQFLPGLVLMILCYVALTVVRDFRDNFEAELFRDLGYGRSAGIFAAIETPIGVLVMLLTAGLTVFRNNLAGLMAMHGMMLAGLMTAGLSTLAFRAGWLPPLGWLGAVGFGLYLAYVPFNCVFYERLIATFRVVGNVGFLMYLSDAFGYLGSVTVLLVRQFAGIKLSWVQFFGDIVLDLAMLGGGCVIASAIYFRHKATHRSSLPVLVSA